MSCPVPIASALAVLSIGSHDQTQAKKKSEGKREQTPSLNQVWDETFC